MQYKYFNDIAIKKFHGAMDFNDHVNELETGGIKIMSKTFFDRTFSQRQALFQQNALVVFLEKEMVTTSEKDKATNRLENFRNHKHSAKMLVVNYNDQLTTIAKVFFLIIKKYSTHVLFPVNDLFLFFFILIAQKRLRRRIRLVKEKNNKRKLLINHGPLLIMGATFSI